MQKNSSSISKNKKGPSLTKIAAKKFDLQATTLQQAKSSYQPDPNMLNQARFSYYNPFKHQDFGNAKMYWSSRAEV